MLSFGSGIIKGVVAMENVQVGRMSSMMDEGKMLNFQERFEGILGLGVPRDPVKEKEKMDEMRKMAEQSPFGGAGGIPGLPGGNSPEGKQAIEDMLKGLQDIMQQGGGARTASPAGEKLAAEDNTTAEPIATVKRQIPGMMMAQPPPSFLDQSGVKRFGICFNEGSNGVLRLGAPPVPGAIPHGAVGSEHWGLDFRGVSVAGKEVGSFVRMPFCSAENMTAGQQTPCGAIPDSGTTMMTGS